MRTEVRELCLLGSLPKESEANVELLEKIEKLLQSIKAPVTSEEAKSLTMLFGEDSCFGMAWTLLHLIETAPALSLPEPLANSNNEWVRRLIDRAIQKG